MFNITYTSGDFFSYNDRIFMVVEIEYEKETGVYFLRYRDLNDGKERTEPFTYEYLIKMPFHRLVMEYLSETEETYKLRASSICLYDEKIIEVKKEILINEIELIKERLPIVTMNKVKPVYINCNPNNVNFGKAVFLASNTRNVNIKYTVDGSDPKVFGLRYNGPIIVVENFKLRCYAYKEGYIDSVETEFDFVIQNKEIRVYLSPSSQDKNLGIEGSGFSNEMIEMNKVANVVERILRKNGIIVFRNNPETSIEDWQKEGREKNVDLHLAIHSNGSTGHWKKGSEVWINDESSKTYSLASMIQTNIYSIYHDNRNVITNRGVRYANGYMMEVDPNRFPFGILIEIAYHDNLEDALWIMKNINNLGEVIARTIIDYYNLR